MKPNGHYITQEALSYLQILYNVRYHRKNSTKKNKKKRSCKNSPKLSKTETNKKSQKLVTCNWAAAGCEGVVGDGGGRHVIVRGAIGRSSGT